MSQPSDSSSSRPITRQFAKTLSTPISSTNSDSLKLLFDSDPEDFSDNEQHETFAFTPIHPPTVSPPDSSPHSDTTLGTNQPPFPIVSPHSPVQSPHSSPPHSPHSPSDMATSNIPNQLMPEPFTGDQDVDLWMSKFTRFSQLQGWNETRQLALMPLLLNDKALIWFDSLADEQKQTFEVFKANLFKCYRPHEATRWLRLRQFADRKQQPHESVEDYFQAMTRQGRQLGKTTIDIMETIVAGLLPAISRFVMTRNPKTIDEALDFARTAGVLEQDGSSDKVGVALASLTDQIGALQMDVNRMRNGMRSLVHKGPQSAR